MGVKYTPQQQQVIDTRGCNLLVSAAAGSGKTAVLTERIVKMIGDETKPVDIDRLLVPLPMRQQRRCGKESVRR